MTHEQIAGLIFLGVYSFTVLVVMFIEAIRADRRRQEEKDADQKVESIEDEEYLLRAILLNRKNFADKELLSAYDKMMMEELDMDRHQYYLWLGIPPWERPDYNGSFKPNRY